LNLIELGLAVIYYLPAFMANGSGPLVRNGTPIDGGRVTWDGRRVLGDGKTYEGLVLALTYGTTVGVVISSFLGSEWILISFLESVGAMLGDMLGAFIKRRLSIPRGGRAIGLDQLDFILGSTVLGYAGGLRVSLIQFLFICLFAFVMHLGTNFLAYRLKIKSVPW
jgi:CDP-2,3-bis-(O-geranylgeranyl)-sn-glycerol synthase